MAGKRFGGFKPFSRINRRSFETDRPNFTHFRLALRADRKTKPITSAAVSIMNVSEVKQIKVQADFKAPNHCHAFYRCDCELELGGDDW